MKTYDNKHIKNITFVGAHNSGKTTFTETMLFEAGLINRRGTIEDKNTISDYHQIEKEKQTTVFATPLHTEWRNYKINIIDTPGLDDFIGEIASTMRVADTIVMLVDAQNGVEVGTEILWNYIDKYNKPTVFVINKIDHKKANFNEAYKSIENLAGKNVVKIQYPYIINGAQGIIDVLKMKLYKFPENGGKPEKLSIPSGQLELAKSLHNELVEKAAENDEELMELYFEKGTLNEDEMRKGIKKGMLNHELFPVFCTSALKDMGSGRLMGFIDNVAPSAIDLKEEQSIEGKTINRITEDNPTIFIFKTLYEPNVGQISFFKVKSGTIKQGDKLINSRTNEQELINQLFVMDGKNRQAVQKLEVGDIGATIKLKDTKTNDTLSKLGGVTIKPIRYPEPRVTKAIFVKNKNDDEKLSEALKKISNQDPTAQVAYSNELKQMLLSCQGELHLATIEWQLKNEYRVEPIFKKPKIAYRETIQKSAISKYKHKKQSGGAGQFAEVHLKIEPYFKVMDEPEGFNIKGKDEIDLKWGGKLVFYNCIVGGVIDSRYLPAIQKGILEVMENSPLTKSYARDIRVMVFDGKMHSVDSNDISFKIAGANAFKDAFLRANPRLLEPISNLEVTMPKENLGGVMTDLQSRRAVILGIENNGKFQVIKAKIPKANLFRFSTDLRSITHGKGTFKTDFASYEPVPKNIQNDIVKNNINQ
jgi:elongation factor G